MEWGIMMRVMIKMMIMRLVLKMKKETVKV